MLLTKVLQTILEVQDGAGISPCDNSSFLAILVPGATIVRPNSALEEFLRVGVEVGDGLGFWGDGLEILRGNLLSPAEDVVTSPRDLGQHGTMRDWAIGAVEDEVIRHSIDLNSEERIWVDFPTLLERGTPETNQFPWRNEGGVKASCAHDHVELLLSISCLDSLLGYFFNR